jgi:hypothetical protein
MPNINEFIGPKPTKENISNLEKVIGSKPCAKCDLDVEEYYWDPFEYIMTWTCESGHLNTVKVNG